MSFYLPINPCVDRAKMLKETKRKIEKDIIFLVYVFAVSKVKYISGHYLRCQSLYIECVNS